MASDPQADAVAALPWKDRPGTEASVTPSPRSERDLAILRSLVRRIPENDAGAHNNLGVVFYNKSMYAEAAERFEHALELDHRMQVAERNLQIVYFGTPHFDSTLRILQATLESTPEDTASRERLARMFLFGGDAGSALREFEKLQKASPGRAAHHRWIARSHVRLGDLDGALSTLIEGVSVDARDAELPLLIGEVMYLRGMAAEARNWLERSLRLDDTSAEAHHLLAFVYGELGDDSTAHRHATRSAELNPSYARADRSLSLDGYNEARYAELVGNRTDRPSITERGGLIHYNLGLALRQKSLHEDAMREFRIALEHGEDRFLVMQAQAETMLLSGDSEHAIARYTELIEQEPASPKLWNELGVAHHQLGEVRQAEEMYGRALGLDDGYALARNNLAVARHHRGETDARAGFEAALDGGRSLAEVARNLGWLLHVRREWTDAERAYRHALDVDPRLASAWTGLGMLYLERGQPDQAARTLARAVECDPLLPEAHYHYAFALSASGDYPGALRETSRALELNPYITVPRFRLLVDLQFEDVSVAAPDLDNPARIATGSTIESFDFDASDLDAALGGVEEPVREPHRELAPPEPSTPASIEWLAAARSELAGGQFAEAMSAVQRAAGAGGNRIEVQLLQGEIHASSGAAGEAVERFEAVLAELDTLMMPEATGLDEVDVRRRALAGLARSLLDLDRPEPAIRAAERWHAMAPRDIDAILTLADAFEENGQPRRATKLIASALETQPDNPELLTRLGAAYVGSGELQLAERELRRAIDLRPDLPAARASLGRLLGITGRPDAAVGEYRAALESIPSFAAAALGLADLLAEHRRVNEAVEVLAGFLEVDPYHFAALVRLGDLLWGAGRQAEAGFAYRRVLRFDPGHPDAREGLERLEPAESQEIPASWHALME
jgi:tetratricopeptide (TPR) repeat protein